MFVASNFLFGITQVLDMLLSCYFWIIIAATVLSWFHFDPYHPISRVLHTLTEPIFYRVRKYLPFTFINGLDFSPVVVVIVIQLIQSIVIRSLFQYAAKLN